MARHLQAARYDEASKAMPRTMQEIVSGDHPPVSLLARSGVPLSQMQAQIEFELVKILPLVSVGGSLNSTQVEFVAGALLEAYPNETLADFKIAFQRGCIGQYGDIYRLDGIVIRGWVDKYLDEKYQLIEAETLKNKAKREGTRAQPYVLPKDAPGISDVGAQALADMQKIVDATAKQSKIPSMTDADIRKNGQATPPKKEALTAGWATYQVGNYKIQAADRKHAKKLIRMNIKNGTVPFHISRGKSKTRRK
jgi:hypothetical protein